MENLGASMYGFQVSFAKKKNHRTFRTTTKYQHVLDWSLVFTGMPLLGSLEVYVAEYPTSKFYNTASIKFSSFFKFLSDPNQIILCHSLQGFSFAEDVIVSRSIV